MKAHIINIGDELLIGQVVNTNASWMADQLNLRNIEVGEIIVIADKEQDIRKALTRSLNEAQVVLITGGLGPTKDDITKKILCQFFEDELVINEEQYRQVESYFAVRNLPFTEINKAQALVPSRCEVIVNKVGTAPCMVFRKDDKVVVSMPGVPFEMKWLMTNHVLDLVAAHLGTEKILHKTVHTYGIGESFLAEKIGDWESSLPSNIRLAYLPQAGKVRLRLSAYGNDKEALEKVVKQKVEQLKELIPNNIYGYDDDTIASAIGRELLRRDATIATAESCTAGLVAHLISQVAGASRYLKGGMVVYSDEMKVEQLGVDVQKIAEKSAVSEDVALEMAQKVRLKFGADFGVATTGYSGPDGGTEHDPRGTVYIAIATSQKAVCKKYVFQTIRTEHQLRSANQALFDLFTLL